MSESQIVNLVPTSTGKVRTVCFYCERVSRPRLVDSRGRPSWSDWSRGWSEGCFASQHVNADGSTGSVWTCPACNRLARERQAEGVTPLLVPSPRRVQAIAARREHAGAFDVADRG
ncbi:hypothetical protein [Gordonia sputi]